VSVERAQRRNKNFSSLYRLSELVSGFFNIYTKVKEEQSTPLIPFLPISLHFYYSDKRAHEIFFEENEREELFGEKSRRTLQNISNKFLLLFHVCRHFKGRKILNLIKIEKI
jgi:hypothetical protein